MRQIKILDCTLRDGGCVNDFNFGKSYMNKILHGLEDSGVDIIELGYIDNIEGSSGGRTKYCNERVITDEFLRTKKKDIMYVAMIDYGKYNPERLLECTDRSIDGIRIAFHKENRKDILDWGRKILDKGYKLFIQPMACLRYDEKEMVDLICDINEVLPETTGFYIVDSFGEMYPKEVKQMAYLINKHLLPSIAIGFHSHNNLQLSYANAISLLDISIERELIIDSSIMGMGKGAGNLNTELFAEFLNIHTNKKYNIIPILNIIDTVINQIKENYIWGYAVEYYLSSISHCTPNYARFFYKKHMLSVQQVVELLGRIPEQKKNSFDERYAEKIYYDYNSMNKAILKDTEELRKILQDKEVLLIAPGKSVMDNVTTIIDMASKENIVSIAINNIPPIYIDYVFTTKILTYEMAKEKRIPIISTSNVKIDTDISLKVDYDMLSKGQAGFSDNSAIMCMNLLQILKVKKIILAGFDGFSTDIDSNYYDESLKRPVGKMQAKARNELIGKYIKAVGNKIEIEFITPSIYEQGRYY